MAVNITFRELCDDETITDGTKWHVDNIGQLHIRNSAGDNIAAYAAGVWESVTFCDNPEPIRAVAA